MGRAARHDSVLRGSAPRALLMAVALPLSAQAAPERFQCSIETQAAASIIDLRDRGQSKEFVLGPLPPRTAVFNSKRGSLQARLAVQMYSIIEDVYAHPGIGAASYLAYRAASCAHRNAGRRVPSRFAEVALPMQGCQQKYGQQPSAALDECVAAAIEYYQNSHGNTHDPAAPQTAIAHPAEDSP